MDQREGQKRRRELFRVAREPAPCQNSAQTRPPERPDPKPEIARVRGATLRDHGGTGPAAVLVPSLINPPRILDLGTGTGVLAIAAARSLRRRVLASDIDAQAVRIARDNARLNRAAGLVRVCRANGLAARDIRVRAPFDLIFANILLAPLRLYKEARRARRLAE